MGCVWIQGRKCMVWEKKEGGRSCADGAALLQSEVPPLVLFLCLFNICVDYRTTINRP